QSRKLNSGRGGGLPRPYCFQFTNEASLACNKAWAYSSQVFSGSRFLDSLLPPLRNCCLPSCFCLSFFPSLAICCTGVSSCATFSGAGDSETNSNPSLISSGLGKRW